MIEKVSGLLPQRLIPFNIPENRIARIVLFILGSMIIFQIARSLIGRVFYSQEVRNIEARKYISQGQQCLQDCDDVEAERLFRIALSWQPSDPDLLGLIFLCLGSVNPNIHESIALLTQALEISEADKSVLSFAYLKRGQCYTLLERYDDALKDLTHALTCEITKVGALLIMSQVYCLQRRYDFAMEKCQEALKHDFSEDNCMEFLEVVDICLDQNNGEEALKYLDLALRTSGLLVADVCLEEVIGRKIDIYKSMKGPDQCLEVIKETLKRPLSEDFKARLLLERRKIHLGQNKEGLALDDLIDLANCHPTSPELKQQIAPLWDEEVRLLDSAD